MKFRLIIAVMAILASIAPVRAAKALEALSLDIIIEQALLNSPETLRILRDIADIDAKAFQIETITNPRAEININSFSDNKKAEIEIEQPLRISNFKARGNYAEALRKTANIEKKAMLLELIHSITRGYSSYWALQEQEEILQDNYKYISQKQKLIKQSAQEGRVDIADSKIFQAESLRLKETLRVIQSKKANGASNLLRMAGMKQRKFKAQRPKSFTIPKLSLLSDVSLNEGSIISLLNTRKNLADKRYLVAKQDSIFPEFAPRAIIEQDFDSNDTEIFLGFSVTIPIWDRNNAELSRAIAERKLAQSNLNNLNEQNFANVLAASYGQAKTTQSSASIYRNKIVPQWLEVELIIDKKFQNGQASIFDLFQMRERVVNIQMESLQTYLNSIEARINLESLIGHSLQNIKK